MSKFTDLKAGDYIWGMYDLNWDKHKSSSFYFHPVEYKLDKFLIVKNNLNEPIKYDVSDGYETPEYIIYYEHLIEIKFNNIIYSRYYTDHYNEYKHMPINPSYNEDGPWIELYPDYETAKEHFIEKCNSGIEACNKVIEKENYKKKLYEKSLKQIEE